MYEDSSGYYRVSEFDVDVEGKEIYHFIYEEYCAGSKNNDGQPLRADAFCYKSEVAKLRETGFSILDTKLHMLDVYTKDDKFHFKMFTANAYLKADYKSKIGGGLHASIFSATKKDLIVINSPFSNRKLTIDVHGDAISGGIEAKYKDGKLTLKGSAGFGLGITIGLD